MRAGQAGQLLLSEGMKIEIVDGEVAVHCDLCLGHISGATEQPDGAKAA